MHCMKHAKETSEHTAVLRRAPSAAGYSLSTDALWHVAEWRLLLVSVNKRASGCLHLVSI
jgi:hypothetical protein